MKRRDLLAGIAGAAMLGPLAAKAQQPGKIYRIAIAEPSGAIDRWNEAEGSPPFWREFFEELRRRGLVERRNLIVERYSGEGRSDRFAELAHTVIAANPDVIFCGTLRLAAAFKAATATIPIVAEVADPVAFGLVSSLAHPGGNLTGVVEDGGLEFYAKHLELLREMVPGASRIAYLTPRAVWDSPILLAPVKEAAKQAEVTLIPAVLEAPIREAEYRRVFALLAQGGAEAVIVGSSVENSASGRLIVELAAQTRLPAIYPGRRYAVQGGLMAYGSDLIELYRRAAADIAAILNGANPGDIPFYRASRFELVINLETARALGLTVTQLLLAQADEVIE